jgi:hypothetical protein
MIKNTWGSTVTGGDGKGYDQQRVDLFRISLVLPSIPGGGGLGVWDDSVQFAIQSFPFPEMKVQTFPTKYLQQTNHQLGGDEATAPTVIPVRYAFSQKTAQTLYKWQYLISNPVTGGVGLTTACKCNGEFVWLVPNMGKQRTDAAALGGEPSSQAMTEGLVYKLEGCLITGLKPMDADMTQGNSGVTLSFSLHIDRYFPIRPAGDLIVVSS